MVLHKGSDTYTTHWRSPPAEGGSHPKKDLNMKCHRKIALHAQALPMQQSKGLRLKFDLNAENSGPQRSEFSTSNRLKQNPAVAIDADNEDCCLIYAVDDEPGLLDLYTILLEAHGYVVRTFDNRIHALAELKGGRRKPDLLIMDYFGHAMSVDGFMQQCLLAHPGLRILVASGFSQLDARFAYVKPDRFIQKPFTGEEFLQEVKAALAV
jgi:CheY-like chemotaxis protein